MKLLTKTNRVFLSFSVGIYLITAIAFYGIIKYMIYNDVESRLLVEKRDFEAYIKTHNAWSSSCYFVENKIGVVPVKKRTPIEPFKDTLILNRYDHELVPFRQLTFYAAIQGIEHRVSIRKSLIQSYQLIEVITVSMVAFLGLLLLCSYWFQARMSGRLWQPFYSTLSQVRGFDLSSGATLQLGNQDITEFNELNEVLQKMSNQIHQDYQSLKEFTENASHEIQTPLALINARVEQLIQSETLTESQSYWIDEIYRASRRMSKVNQGLLLLAKIENRQFADLESIDLYALLREKLGSMEELLQYKQIRLQTEQSSPFIKSLPPLLADILMTNVVSNAIRHNQTGGFIRINVQSNQLSISNSGPDLHITPERLFERFKKEAAHSESVGLGLAIVKQIGDSYGLTITYHFSDGIHSICLQ